MSELESFLCFLAICVIGICLCVCIGHGCGRDAEREQAVKAGVGRYSADPKTGTTSFVYGK